MKKTAVCVPAAMMCLSFSADGIGFGLGMQSSSAPVANGSSVAYQIEEPAMKRARSVEVFASGVVPDVTSERESPIAESDLPDELLQRIGVLESEIAEKGQENVAAFERIAELEEEVRSKDVELEQMTSRLREGSETVPQEMFVRASVKAAVDEVLRGISSDRTRTLERLKVALQCMNCAEVADCKEVIKQALRESVEHATKKQLTAQTRRLEEEINQIIKEESARFEEIKAEGGRVSIVSERDIRALFGTVNQLLQAPVSSIDATQPATEKPRSIEDFDDIVAVVKYCTEAEFRVKELLLRGLFTQRLYKALSVRDMSYDAMLTKLREFSLVEVAQALSGMVLKLIQPVIEGSDDSFEGI